MRPSTTSALYQPLDRILGSPALVRVTRVLADHGGSLGVADIARRARLALPSTRVALRKLIESQVVTAVGMGRSMVCALRPAHPLVPALSELFAAEREQADMVLAAVRRAAAQLRPAPLAVWLYGSVSRGADHPMSDIDVALVSAVSDPTSQAALLREGISTELPEREQQISVIAMSPADAQRLAREGAKLWRAFERDAVVLVGDAPKGVLESMSHSNGSRRW